MTEKFRDVADEKLAALPRSPWHRLRIITYWTLTVLLVFELVAGSVWNFRQIEWVRIQLSHLGYPLYFAYVLGVWLIGGAAVIIAPGSRGSRNGRTRVPFFNSRVPWRRTCSPATMLVRG
jgi:hypothetical protein